MTLEERLRALELSKPDLIMRVAALEKSMSNVDDHINRLNKETIDIGFTMKNGIDTWLKKYPKKIINNWLSNNKSLFHDMKIKELSQELNEWITISTNRYEELSQKIENHLIQSGMDKIGTLNTEEKEPPLYDYSKGFLKECPWCHQQFNLEKKLIEDFIADLESPLKRQFLIERYKGRLK